MFKKYRYRNEYVERMLRYYTYLNRGLVIRYNGKRFRSKDGLKDLLEENISETPLYPIIHIEGNDIEVAFTHLDQYGEDYFPLSMDSTPPRGALIRLLFAKPWLKRSETSPKRILRLAIFGAASLRQSALKYKSQCLSRRPRQTWFAHSIPRRRNHPYLCREFPQGKAG